MTPDLHQAALALARRGLSVAPLHNPVRAAGGMVCSCARGADCPSPAKHPRTAHGISEATSDPDVVTAWWSRWPSANIGLACGPSRLIVVDLDGGEAVATWRDIIGQHPKVVTTAARTARGWHLYFGQPRDREPLGNSASRLAPGVDTRGAGGYVLTPPSVHVTGHRYAWHDEGAGIAPCPTWLADLLQPPMPARTPTRPITTQEGSDRALVGLVAVVLDAQPGGRNAALFWASCRAREHVARGHMNWSEAEAALGVAAAAVGLAEHEIASTMRSSGRSASA